jgi:hypothetical protein
MSVYTHARMPAPSVQQPVIHRRQPFSNATAPNQPHLAPSPVKPQENPKANPPDPPLPRQNSKTTPPSPPRLIVDKHRQAQYYRVGFLGEVRFGFIADWSALTLRVSCREDSHAFMKSQMGVTVPHSTLLARLLPNHPSRRRRPRLRQV